MKQLTGSTSAGGEGSKHQIFSLHTQSLPLFTITLLKQIKTILINLVLLYYYLIQPTYMVYHTELHFSEI
jgi:hypothetical protein